MPPHHFGIGLTPKENTGFRTKAPFLMLSDFLTTKPQIDEFVRRPTVLGGQVIATSHSEPALGSSRAATGRACRARRRARGPRRCVRSACSRRAAAWRSSARRRRRAACFRRGRRRSTTRWHRRPSRTRFRRRRRSRCCCSSPSCPRSRRSTRRTARSRARRRGALCRRGSVYNECVDDARLE